MILLPLMLIAGCDDHSNADAGSAAAAAAPRPAAGLVFYDDFTASVLTTTGPHAWHVMKRPGDSSNQELECYLPANVAVNVGLIVVSRREPGSVCSPSFNSNYTSGMVQWKSFNFTYGTVEFKAKMAGGNATWPAVWLLGADCQVSNQSTADNIDTCNWPKAGSNEIDIAEILGGNLTKVNQNVIDTSGASNRCLAVATDVSRNRHIYRFVWTSASLTWYIDNVQTCQVTSPSLIPKTPLFLIINTAIGGTQGATPVDGTLPQSTIVEYVKVTQP